MQDLCCSLWNIVEACGIFSCSTWDLHCGIQALLVCGRQDLRCSMWGLFLLWYVGSLLQNVGSFTCSTLDLLVVACRIFVVECRILVAACGISFHLWYVGSLLQHVGFFFFFCSMTDLLNCNMWDSLVGTCEVFLVAEYEILIVVVWDFLL